ncbi:MAG: amidohydrolase family protein [Saprospiraceae bacterium]
MNKFLNTLIALLMLVVSVDAQTVEELLKPVTGTYAIKDVTIIQKPGQQIEKGTIVIKDGIIHAVGANVKVPADAEVLEADGMYVYAGFIDGLSNVGVPAPKQSGNNNRASRPSGAVRGNPPNSLAGITPEISASDKISMTDGEIKALRKLGFTTVHVAPRGGMLPGKSAVIVLAGDKATDMIIKEDVALVATFQGGPRVFPSTIMAVMTKYRELFGQARQLLAHQKAYAANPAMVRPESNETLEALIPAIEGKQPVFMVAPGVKDLYRALTLEKDLDVNMTMAGVQQGWYVADQLKASKKPILVSMDLPKEIKEKKASDKKKDPEYEALEARKMKAYNEHLGQAATMSKAAIPFAFASMGTKSSDISGNLKRMIKAGLSADQALTALTTAPAEMLGLSKVLGTVEKGKIANLVISDQPYFGEKSNVRFVVADGTVFPYAAPKKRAAGEKGAKKAAVGGAWSYTIDIPGQTTDGTLTLEDSNGEITGKAKTTQTPEATINDAELEGNVLTFSLPVDVQGQSLTLEFELTFDGDKFDGTVVVGAFGTFDIEGSKTPE